MGAYPTTYRWERNRLSNERQGLAEAPLRCQRYVALDVDAAGAGVGTGRLAELLDGVYLWLRARSADVDCFVVGARCCHRANFYTIAAGGTLGQVYVAGTLMYLDAKLVAVAVQARDFCPQEYV